MARLFYMSLTGVGKWNKVMLQSGALLAPYRTYLTTAKKAADNRALSLSWRLPNPDEQKELNFRLQEQTTQAKQRTGKAQRRRDRQASHNPPSGEWIILEPRPDRSEEPEATFDAFLDTKSIYERPPVSRGSYSWSKGAEIAVTATDREALALLLLRLPTEIPPTPTEGSDDIQSGTRLLFLRPNTWPLECQSKALEVLENRPSPRLAPLLRLVSTQASWKKLEGDYVSDSEWAFLRREKDGGLRDGTTEQRQFVRCALGTPDFAILEGPPGSGKTTAICELIVQLARAGKRVLLVASTHVAVDNVLERLIEWQDGADEKLVMPIRIGDENSVTSPSINAWVLRNLQRTWRGEILDHLDRPGDIKPEGAEARRMLKQALTPEGKESGIARLLLDASNLVCGTTIGILQHPAIKDAGKSRTDIEPFDYLILDEASKTTFTEFLVPAIYAKRWVVVGDRRQLSPYVEEQDLAENLRGLLPDEVAQAITHSFMASSAIPKGMQKRSLVAVASDEEARWIRREADARKVAAIDLDSVEPSDACIELTYADLVFGTADTIEAWQHRLPGDLQIVGGNLPELPDWEAHRRALLTETDQETTTWADEVAWRQIRTHELRLNLSEQKRYLRELDELLPKTLAEVSLPGQRRPRTSKDGHTQTPKDILKEDLEHMRRVSMPSILEILQVGAGPLWEDKTALTDGLPKPFLDERMVSLSFQHRMHPDIAAFPRAQFYTEAGLLQDATGIGAAREWGYSRYARRAAWLEILPKRQGSGRNQSRNRNPAEADAVMRELREFVQWAASTPHPGKNPETPWEVAVLTFYRGQEKELRLRLQKECGQPGNTRNFHLGKGRVHVTLCTADRFQGHEADLVLLSFVKTGSVGFLNSPNRLNVALTRARYQVVLVGNRRWMASDRCHSELINALGASPLYAHDIGWEKS